MNKLFLTAILILCLPMATALDDNKTWYGGETWIYNFPECSMLEINVTATLQIDDGEYTILNNCTDNNNSFVCDCYDDYNLTVSFKTNAVNNYTFDFNYDYTNDGPPEPPFPPEESSTPSSSGGGGGSYSSSWICSDWGECINNKSERVCIKGTNKNINYTQSKSCVSKTKEPKEVKEEEIKVEDKQEEKIIKDITAVIKQNETKPELPTEQQQGWVYLGITLITIIFAILGWFIFKNKSDSD